MTIDVDFAAQVNGVLQGYPGAAEVLRTLKATFPGDYGLVVGHLYARGPRGPKLWEAYRDRYESDALVLGRDLIALAQEQSGWDRP